MLSPTECLRFCNLATSTVISGPVLICSSGKQLYSALPLGDEAVSAITQNPTQSHYPDTERTGRILVNAECQGR